MRTGAYNDFLLEELDCDTNIVAFQNAAIANNHKIKKPATPPHHCLYLSTQQT